MNTQDYVKNTLRLIRLAKCALLKDGGHAAQPKSTTKPRGVNISMMQAHGSQFVELATTGLNGAKPQTESGNTERHGHDGEDGLSNDDYLWLCRRNERGEL